MATGKELKRLREASKMTSKYLANLLGVSEERLRKWEQNDSTPRLEDAIKIENYFGTKLENLPKLTEVPKTSKNRKPEINTNSGSLSEFSENNSCKKCEELQRIIEAQKMTIDTQQKTIISQEQLLDFYKQRELEKPTRKRAG